MAFSVKELEMTPIKSANPSIHAAVESARELLDMDVAYATEFTKSDQVLKVLTGFGESFGLREGLSLYDLTYCKRILAGELPGLMPDVAAQPLAASMQFTKATGIRSFISVPIRLGDGSVYGTLCTASHQARHDLGERELRVFEAFARMIADQVGLDRSAKGEKDLEVRVATAEALAAALDARDSYTGMHSRAVFEGVPRVAAALGLEADDVREVEHVALLHDVGKIAIPDDVLQKPGPLDEAEWELMREHPVLGERLVGTVAGLEHLGPAVRAEHERWDGAGYPDGLAGEEIPLASRIVFVCDAYHAMRSDRPYRKALPPEEAKRRLADNLGTQFCPSAGGALLSVLNQAEAV